MVDVRRSGNQAIDLRPASANFSIDIAYPASTIFFELPEAANLFHVSFFILAGGFTGQLFNS
jgi:hypothetical protein